MKIPRGTLVMVVDGRKLLLFRNEGDVKDPALQTIAHEHAENPRSGIQGTDRPGRSHARIGPRRSALGETDWHEEAENRFAIEAMKKLEEVSQDTDAKIILMADPSSLGEIRKRCPAQVKSSIIAEIGKDVAHHTTEDIVRIIDAYEP